MSSPDLSMIEVGHVELFLDRSTTDKRCMDYIAEFGHRLYDAKKNRLDQDYKACWDLLEFRRQGWSTEYEERVRDSARNIFDLLTSIEEGSI